MLNHRHVKDKYDVMCGVPMSLLFAHDQRARSEQNHVQSMQQFFSLKEHHATPMMKLNKGKKSH